jgi:putative chitinase
MKLDDELLSRMLSRNKNVSPLVEIFNELFPKYEINTVNRVSGFLAQCGHESNDFTVLKENLNYSADGLNKVFPKYFKNAGRDANDYARNPEKIANVVYANRMGNGDISSGDGWKYRGRGAIQLTGKDNYSSFAKYIGKSLDETVSYCETLQGAVESACWFWKTRNLNETCDKDDIVTMTKKIERNITITIKKFLVNYVYYTTDT